MLPPDTLDEIDNYWVAHLGCPPERLFESPVVVLPHSAFKGYQGLFLVRRGKFCVVSAPGELINLIHTCARGSSVDEVFGSGLWRQQLPDLLDRVVGPASIAYCDGSTLRPQELPGTLPLDGGDREALEQLRAACDPDDWDRAGILPAHPAMIGHWIDGRLVSAAGYEVWGERIAHIGVATEPAHRGQGYGKAAVSALALQAIECGLIAQFRTLIANRPAMAIARALGFEEYAQTFAIGLNVPRSRACLDPDARPAGDEAEAETED